MRIFKTKGFARFQRRDGIDDAALCEAIARAERGLIDANLGHGLIKQRVARHGEGKRGGFRTIMAYRAGDRSVFLYGFAKNELDNIDDDELQDWRAQSEAVIKASDALIEANVIDERLKEVDCGNEEET